jgi:CHASE2 domain-containing sensor protein
LTAEQGRARQGPKLGGPADRLRFPRTVARALRADLPLFVVIFLLNIAVGWINPFGIDDVIKERAATLIQIVTGPLRGETPGQSAVTVVLIDETFLNQTEKARDGAVWPLPVNILTHGVVRRVLDAEPKALFVDIAFPDAPREISAGSPNSRQAGATALAQSLIGLAERSNASRPGRPIPIFLADALSAGANDRAAGRDCAVEFISADAVRGSNLLAPALVDELFAANRPANFSVVDTSWLGDTANYHLAPARVGHGGNCMSLEAAGEGFVPSPALALFKAYMDDCAQDDEAAICSSNRNKTLAGAITPAAVKLASVADAVDDLPDAPANPEAGGASSRRSDPLKDGLRLYQLQGEAPGSLSLRWGMQLSPTMTRHFKAAEGADECYDQFHNGGSLAAVRNYLLYLAGPIRKAFDHERYRRCPYIDTISAADLQDARSRAGCADGTGGTCNVAGDFIKDRLVLLGVDLRAAGDRFQSPLNGTLPGVYLHAVALENLLSSGAAYPQSSPGFWQQAIVNAFGTALLLLMMRFWSWLRTWRKRIGPVAVYLVAPLVYLLVALGILVPFSLWALNVFALPLTELAVPAIALHVLLFASMVTDWKLALRRLFNRLQWRARRGGVQPGGQPASPA